MSEINETLETAKAAATEVAAKVKQSKYAGWIKIGAVVLAAILVISLIGSLFSDKNAKAAEKRLVTSIEELLEEADFTGIKVKAKLVAKNKDAYLYCFDTTVTCKYDGEKETKTSFYIMYADGEDIFLLNEFDYEKENKKDAREIAIAFVEEG